MNKIVRNHYAAADLPADLRGSIDISSRVSVTVEVEPLPLGREALVAMTRAIQTDSRGTTPEEAVARIRALRDEWDD